MRNRLSAVCQSLVCFFMLTNIVWSQSTSSPWPPITRECKPGVIWWIPGSAMTRPDTTYNLERLAEAGFGGMSMVPIYGVHGAEDRFLDHLSPEWNDQFEFVVSEAERLGLWVDLTPGTGWKIGGPAVTPEMGEQSVRLVDGKIVARRNGSKVKRAAPGGAGLSIDPYDSETLIRFLDEFGKRLHISPTRMPRAFYHDSFEYTGNWTSSLPEKFQQQHGYDILQHAEALFGEGNDREHVARIQADYRATLADLHYEFVSTLKEWAHSHDSQLREQAHGSPGNVLDLYALADIPETEVFGANHFQIRGFRREEAFVRPGSDHSPLVNRMASSAAHLSGGKLVSSESFTWLREHFNVTLADIKPEVDSLFVTGVNHLFYHGNCYSPQNDTWPGWLFYASTEVNWRNAFWRDISTLNAYIARSQSVLQTGQADNDVLLYWPVHDVYMQPGRSPHQFFKVHNHQEWLTDTPCGALATQFAEAGIAFDFVSDRFLEKLQIHDGQLRIGDAAYKVIVVPNCQYMPPSTLQQLLSLAEQGATIVFCGELPSDVPGLGNLQQRRDEFNRLKDRISDQPGVFMLSTKQLLPWLNDHGAAVETDLVANHLQFIRRATDQRVYYFITNPSAQDVDGWIRMSRPFASVKRLDPLTGKHGRLAMRSDEHSIYLQLTSGESCIVCLEQATAKFENNVPTWPIWKYVGEPCSLDGDWEVEFVEGAPELPAAYRTTSLESWTTHSDTAATFAGTAKYRISFSVDRDQAVWRLDLGDVRETARISIDGNFVQTLVANPFACTLPAINHGEHLLEIEVTNLSSNRIRDLDRQKVDWKKFYDINYVNVNYKPFDASTWAVRPSGLLGPVTFQLLEQKDMTSAD
ncbi:MAG: hypothetical protein KDA87_12125 [Planctomycetales bacterium]|nr:hypothetical protein [Planctomycetales bacterium]